MSRSFGNMKMSNLSTDWEDLRKQARQLENEIDAKLMSFSKLSSNYLSRDQTTSHHLGLDSPSVPTSSSFDAMSIEIEKLLECLSDVNKRMAEVIPALPGSNPAATHTLQRHREISQDYRREFDRTKANIRNFKTREEFLTNNNNNNNSNKSESSVTGLSSRRQDYYLRELEQLNNSNRLMDSNLERAAMLKKNLIDQRRLFLNITHKLKTLTNRFPLLNNIMQKIKFKKRKDSLVLGFVIALCLIFLLIYMFR